MMHRWKKLLDHKAYYQTYLLYLMVLVGFVGIYLIALQPIRNKREATVQSIAVLNEQVESLRQYDMPAKEFEEAIDQLKLKQKNALSILPQSTDNFAAITFLSNTIKSNNLNIRALKVSDSTVQNGCLAQRFDCVVGGGYFELVALLEYLQKTNPLTDVQISSINTENDGKLVITMQIYIYALQ